MTPFFAPTRGVAVRQFQAAVNDPNHELHKFAEDYTLFELGVFFETHQVEPISELGPGGVQELRVAGKIEGHSAPIAITTAVSLRETPVQRLPDQGLPVMSDHPKESGNGHS